MPTASPVLSEVIRQFTDGLRSEHVRDSDLLETFALNQNEVAFSDLVARHGPLVWGVCRRGLTDANDAEDAFQATFLALARQAQSLAERVAEHETLAGWLYLTARRITNNVRRARIRRYEHERRAAADRSTLTDQPVEPAVSELGAVLDEELDRLPARFRDPLVLCYFQGRSHADAAKQIGCPVGTVSGRLARGCELLREGLAKRGVVLGIGQIGVAIAVAGSAGRVAAAIPPALAHSTVAAARSFAAGGAVTTEAGRLAIGVAQATNWLKVKLSCLVIVATLGMTAAAALLSEEPTHAEAPKDARVAANSETKPHADAFGDALPDGAVARMGTLRFRTGKMGTASSVVFGGNDKQLISVHGSDAVYVWDPITGRELRRLDGPQLCNAVSTTPNGRRLVAIGHTEAWAWDLAAEPPVVLWKAKIPKMIHGNIELSPDGRVVAVGGESKGNALLLDAATGEVLRTIAAGGSGLAFSADSKLLGVWARANGIRADAKTDVAVWSVADGKQQYTLPTGEGRSVVASVAFSPDGKTVASVGADRVIRLTNAEDGKARQSLSEDAAPLAHLGFLRDGTLVEAGGGHIRFWDVTTGKQSKAAVKAVDAADAYRLSADGTKLARAGIFGVGLREVATGKEIGPNAGMPDGLVHSATFTPDGKSLVMAVYSEAAGAALHLWDATNGRLRSQVEVGPKQIVWGLDVGADGSISGASVPLYQTPSPPIRIMTWDADLSRVRSAFNLPAGVQAGAASPDKRHVALGSGSRVTLCDRTTGKEVRVLSTKCTASSLAFSADGKCLGALDSSAKRVTIWSLADGHETNWTPPASKHALLAPLTLSPDGSLFATSVNGSVRVVETVTGEELWQVGAHLSGLPAQEFVFSPNGRLLAAAGTDGVVRVWEVASGEERYHFTGHRAGVFSVAFSPDSQRLASASYDSTALVWDVGTLAPTQVVRATAEEQWSALSGRDARSAARAIVALTESPATAVTLLRKKLLLPSASVEQIRGWLADLGDAEFQVRETASRELAKRGDLVLPDLRKALADASSAEVRGRLERLLARLGAQSPDRRAVIRGVETLERMGTNPAAKQLLRELAEAPAESLLGREAKAAYQRLKPSPQ